MLIDSMRQEFVFVERRRVSDGEGGFATEWVDGETFHGALVYDNTMQARIAEKQGVTALFTLTVDIKIPLEYHDVFRRVSDGATFRVTSEDEKQTPKTATFQFRQVTVEKWRLTT